MALKRLLAPYRAPAWKPDRSEFITLWHGTLSIYRQGIEGGIDLSRCAVDTDFGQGFYTTTTERQARLWAWDRYNRWRYNPLNATGARPVVLRFRVRRYSTVAGAVGKDQGLDSLDMLDFVRGGFDNEDFWSLVQHCRFSTPAGPNGQPPAVIRNHRRVPGKWYDVVAGPVSAFWDQRVAMADSDQYSFHTDDAIAVLDGLIAGGNPDDYTCLPVP